MPKGGVVIRIKYSFGVGWLIVTNFSTVYCIDEGFEFFNLEAQALKAYHLSTGWTSRRICHLCTGVDWHIPCDFAQWHVGGSGPSPFKSLSPFLDIPGCGGAGYAQLDYCHAFHLGTGMDLAASCVVYLCKLGHFGNARGLNDRMMAAFARYSSWCHETKRVTTITRFSKLEFDMSTTLAFNSGLIVVHPNALADAIPQAICAEEQ